MDYLSIVACFKNEAPYLREWLEFHRLVGVERFYLYDNASSDNPDTVLQPYIDKGIVKAFWTDMQLCQFACYFNALRVFEQQTRWIAFIDLDEFLFCPNGQDIRELLRDYEQFPVLGAGWVIFGSSGHKRKPEGLTIENYIRCAERGFEAHIHIKSIVNPNQVYCPAANPHDFIVSNRTHPPIDENRVPLHGPFRGPNAAWTIDRIRLNHYFTRSWEEWCTHKRPRGKADIPSDALYYIRPESDFSRHDRNEIEDTTILRYLPELKRRLRIS